MSTATRDALLDYQAAAARIIEARAAAEKARAHIRKCSEAEHRARVELREAAERLGSDPLGLLSRSLSGQAHVMATVLDSLPGTVTEVVQGTGLTAEQVSNALNKARRAGRAWTDGSPGRAGIWRRVDDGGDA